MGEAREPVFIQALVRKPLLYVQPPFRGQTLNQPATQKRGDVAFTTRGQPNGFSSTALRAGQSAPKAETISVTTSERSVSIEFIHAPQNDPLEVQRPEYPVRLRQAYRFLVRQIEDVDACPKS